ncbi:MAG: hypothetical protein LBG80_16840 [Bacteroidales bacterium]|jgi:hypothetical protein|nr:hypothetical protein [Bacteroidales bacterium]
MASTNIYWPIFKSIEQETIKLSYNIHFDDNQLNVYSTKIMDLILRAAAEIESISKELYKLNGGTKTGEIKFDSDAIEHLKDKWLIDKKEVIVSHPNCFQTTKIIMPFIKNETRTKKEYSTYGWNNAYQSLKHDRANSMHFGSIKYLFDILAVLYILNIYYKDENFNLGTDSQGVNFPINVGSDLFSITLSKEKGGFFDGSYHKNIDFDRSVYFLKKTQNSLHKEAKAMEEINQEQNNLLLSDLKINEYLNGKTIIDLNMELAIEILGREDFSKLLGRNSKLQEFRKVLNDTKYEAILNKNQI